MILDATFTESNHRLKANFGLEVKPDVFNLEYANNTFANAIKGTSSNKKNGVVSNVGVYITDVSPIDHNINVKVDNANAQVVRSGKNLFDSSCYQKYDKKGITIEYLPDEDCFELNGTCTSRTSEEGFNKLKKYIVGNIGDIFSLSTVYVSGEINVPSGYARPYFGVAESLDATKPTNWLDTPNMSTETEVRENFGLTKKYISHFWFLVSEGVTFKKYKVRVQLEKNQTATDYQKNVTTEHIPDADGTVLVPSVYPTTVLTTDTEGVTINAEYNRDTNKVIAELSQAIINLGGTL